MHRKFHRKRGPRRSFLKSLAHNFIIKGKIETTVTRAKELRPMVERFITAGKKNQISALRRLLAMLPKDAAYKVYHDLAPKYADRKGGYVRITKEARMRKRDGVRMARIEFV